ncbi:MAG: hypothetical protein JST75_01945 [Bacteroidetes bacterium]|nr:hypothetical protein [Bacteroidota bacterium]
MKNIIFLFLISCISSISMGQLKAKPKCGTFVVDILNGKVNNIKPDVNIPEIKDALPCFTSVEEETATSKCGGGVFYKDRDISFFTSRDYIEIGEKLKGQLSIPLIGASRSSLFKWLGNPKIKDDTWDAFVMAYGTLVLHYNAAGKVKLIQFSTRNTDDLKLCE